MSNSLGFFRVILLLTFIGAIILVGASYKIYKETEFAPMLKFTLGFVIIAMVAIFRFFIHQIETIANADTIPGRHEMLETFIEMFHIVAAFFFGWAFYMIYQQRKKVDS